MVDKKGLIEFNKELEELYNSGKIKSPVHASGGNEDELIKIFKHYKKGDWIFSTHRSHFHWLLSGRSKSLLLKQIMEGHSMHIFDDRFFTSAIVSGIAPIALGTAKALAMKCSPNKVWCFVGDMAGTGGLVHECIRYAEGWDLPITYVIEDNAMSVRANTEAVWGIRDGKNKVIKYTYKREFPHSGFGKYLMW
jgi:pyruvate dehydrogenase E1 component alpha subunit